MLFVSCLFRHLLLVILLGREASVLWRIAQEHGLASPGDCVRKGEFRRIFPIGKFPYGVKQLLRGISIDQAPVIPEIDIGLCTVQEDFFVQVVYRVRNAQNLRVLP